MILSQPNAADFEMQLDEEHSYPFFEDEDANWIIGLGHQDRAEFARLVNEFDTVAAGLDPDPACDELQVEWQYGIVSGGDEDMYVLLYHSDHTPIRATEPNAVPITVVSR